MKHRSIITFILLAAALVAAPQVSHDLSALKSALGARIRGEILHAFLSLHAHDAENDLAPLRANAQLASCETQEKTDAQPAAASKKAERPAPRAETAAQPDAHEQLAMLDTPSPDSDLETPEAELTGDRQGLNIGEASELTQTRLAQSELAMLVPPGTGVDVPRIADNHTNDARAKDSTRRRQNSADAQKRATYLTASFKFTQADASKASEEILQRLASTWTDADAIRATENVRLRVLKFKRAGRATVAKPAAFAPQPVPVAALMPPDYSLPSAPRASGEE